MDLNELKEEVVFLEHLRRSLDDLKKGRVHEVKL